MTIVVNIKREVQEELSRQAAAHGVDISSYAATLLEDAAHVAASQKALSQSQLAELSQFSHKIPLLPEEAFSRANWLHG